MSPPERPALRLLSEVDVGRIVQEAFDVLATIGVRVENAEGRDLLLQAGAAMGEGRLRIPERIVAEALDTAPRRVLLYNHAGDLTMDLSGDNVYFVPGSAAVHILDSTSGGRRDAGTRDLIDLIRLVDRLPLYAAQSTALTPADVPPSIADRYRLYLALRYGRKPVITGTFRKDGFAPMHRMLAAVRGGEEALAEKPLAVFDCCPSPPLCWSDLTCQSLIDCARARVPAELVSMPLAGATAPVTLREAVVQHCAETLSGIVILELARPGSPVIYGGAPAAFDMRHGSTPMGAIETMMMVLAYAQVGKHFGLPTHGYLAVSDSKTPDYQAGLETGIGAALAALAGLNVVAGPGMLDYLLTQSLEKLLLDHEACGMALRLARGVGNDRPGDLGPIDPSWTTIRLFQDLVGAGEFLSHPHTRRFWRQELSIPSSVIDRDTYGEWDRTGRLTAQDRARDQVQRLLAGGEEAPLPASLVSELDAIMDAERASAAGD